MANAIEAKKPFVMFTVAAAPQHGVVDVSYVTAAKVELGQILIADQTKVAVVEKQMAPTHVRLVCRPLRQDGSINPNWGGECLPSVRSFLCTMEKAEMVQSFRPDPDYSQYLKA